MTLLYILIGLAVVYAAYYFGAKKNSSQARLAGHFDEVAPVDSHAHTDSNGAHIHNDSEDSHKQHKSHGGCC